MSYRIGVPDHLDFPHALAPYDSEAIPKDSEAIPKGNNSVVNKATREAGASGIASG